MQSHKKKIVRSPFMLAKKNASRLLIFSAVFITNCASGDVFRKFFKLKGSQTSSLTPAETQGQSVQSISEPLLLNNGDQTGRKLPRSNSEPTLYKNADQKAAQSTCSNSKSTLLNDIYRMAAQLTQSISELHDENDVDQTVPPTDPTVHPPNPNP